MVTKFFLMDLNKLSSEKDKFDVAAAEQFISLTQYSLFHVKFISQSANFSVELVFTSTACMHLRAGHTWHRVKFTSQPWHLRAQSVIVEF